MTDMFRYRKFDEALECPIRLLKLMPGANLSEDLRCQIFHMSLQNAPQGRPSYEPLSYTWGDSEEKKVIKLAYSVSPGPGFPAEYGPITPKNLLVTKNLDAALRHLRLEHSPRILWVDAICINQTDEEEKGQQVQQMHAIYKGAKRVVVWLGEEKDAKIALDYCDTIVRDQYGNIPLNVTNDESMRRACYSLFIDTKERPWWSRTWILQEVIHSREVMVYLGRIQMSMEDLLSKFEKYYFQLLLLASYSPTAVRIPPSERTETQQKSLKYEMWFQTAATATVIPDVILRTRAEIRKDPKADLPRLGITLYQFKDQQSSDPRDKVYGLLGMTKKEYDIKIDYKRSKSDLYTEVARLLLSRVLVILLWVESPSREVQPGLELPSWVPDFTTEQTLVPRCMHSTYVKFDADQNLSNGKAGHEIHSDGRTLILKGIYVGRITGTLISRITAGLFLQGYDEVNLLRYDRNPAMRFEMAPPSPWPFDAEDRKTITFENTTWGPCKSQLGDIIIVAAGCKIPLVVRPCDNFYLFVGCCWLIDREVLDFRKVKDDPGFSPIMFGSLPGDIGIEEFRVK